MTSTITALRSDRVAAEPHFEAVPVPGVFGGVVAYDVVCCQGGTLLRLPRDVDPELTAQVLHALALAYERGRAAGCAMAGHAQEPAWTALDDRSPHRPPRYLGGARATFAD